MPKFGDCAAGPVIALLVVAAGTVIVVSLYRFCKKHLPPPDPPKPPTYVPGQPPCTNCNPQHPSWPCTNCPAPPKLLSLSDQFPVQLTFASEAIDIIDISSNQWTDPYSNVYAAMFVTRLECSTNLLNWQESYAVTGFMSYGSYYGSVNWSWPSNYVAVFYDASGNPVRTNWSFLPDEFIQETSDGAERFYRLTRD